MKSGNKEIAAKKLDDDMDDYWAKKEEGGETAEGEDEGDAADDAKPAAEEAAVE